MIPVRSLVKQQLSRRLGIRVTKAEKLARVEMMLDHYQAATEAARAPLHPDLQARVVLLGRLLKPCRARGHRKIRVGGRHDGGYVMLDDLSRLQVAFSLGVGPNVDWDHAMAQRGLEVHQFDHTVGGPPRKHRLFRFHQRRIDANATSKTENLASLLLKYGPAEEGSAVLKVDIEHSEWPFFASADVSGLQRFPQILCEFHSLCSVHDDGSYRIMVEALRRLREFFEVVHVHGNNSGGRLLIFDQAFPDVLEVTFVNKRMYEFSAEEETFPTILDSPNDENLPDYYLGTFGWDSDLNADSCFLESRAAATQDRGGFDGEAYLRANPDVKTAGLDPWIHWHLFGWREGRPMSIEEKTFDKEAYLRANPDVAAAGLDGLTHWRQFGSREGRPLFLNATAPR